MHSYGDYSVRFLISSERAFCHSEIETPKVNFVSLACRVKLSFQHSETAPKLSIPKTEWKLQRLALKTQRGMSSEKIFIQWCTSFNSGLYENRLITCHKKLKVCVKFFNTAKLLLDTCGQLKLGFNVNDSASLRIWLINFNDMLTMNSCFPCALNSGIFY